jgi:hypothetical protein
MRTSLETYEKKKVAEKNGMLKCSTPESCSNPNSVETFEFQLGEIC